MKLVYFIKPIGMDGPIKIGCTDTINGRLADLMAKSPFPLEVVATIDGDHVLEARFHRQFIKSNTHSEWFRWSPALEATINAIKGGSFCADGLPDPLFLNSRGGRAEAQPHRARNLRRPTKQVAA